MWGGCKQRERSFPDSVTHVSGPCVHHDTKGKSFAPILFKQNWSFSFPQKRSMRSSHIIESQLVQWACTQTDSRTHTHTHTNAHVARINSLSALMRPWINDLIGFPWHVRTPNDFSIVLSRTLNNLFTCAPRSLCNGIVLVTAQSDQGGARMSNRNLSIQWAA